jgi:hypothetical protein
MTQRGKGDDARPIPEAVEARVYDSRWTPDERKDVAVLAEREMQAAAGHVDAAIEAYRGRVRYWMLAEEMAR